MVMVAGHHHHQGRFLFRPNFVVEIFGKRGFACAKAALALALLAAGLGVIVAAMRLWRRFFSSAVVAALCLVPVRAADAQHLFLSGTAALLSFSTQS
jgi:hypothetical protein